MRIQGFFLALLSSLTTLCSCINEDTTECELSQSGVILTYDYSLNMSYANQFEQQTGSLQTFIFNENGILCDTLAPAVKKDELNNQWSRQIELNPGTYTFVTWAGDENFKAHFKINHQNDPVDPNAEGVIIGTTSLNDLRTFLKCNIDDRNDDYAVPQTPHFGNLLHGIAKEITVTQGQITTVNTSLIKDTKNINIKIGKLSKLSSKTLTKENFSLQLTGRNGHYQYDNKINEYTRRLAYSPYELTIANDTLYAKIKTMRLMNAARGSDIPADTRVQLNINCMIKNRLTTVCKDLDLVELILANKIISRNNKGKVMTDANGTPLWVYPTESYLDRQDLFELTFTTTDTEGEITIYINGWKVENITPDYSRSSNRNNME